MLAVLHLTYLASVFGSSGDNIDTDEVNELYLLAEFVRKCDFSYTNMIYENA